MIHLSEKKDKWYRTFVMYMAIICLGMSLAIPGPTLLELEKLVQEDTAQVANIFISRSAGYVLGSLAGGILLDRFKRHKVSILLLCTFLMGVSDVFIPFSKAMWFLLCVMAVSGFSMGALDTGLNVWCLAIWGDDATSYFQGLHFFFGVGACISPLIAGPFLSHESLNDNHTVFQDFNSSIGYLNTTANVTEYLNATTNVTGYMNTTISIAGQEFVSNIVYPYFIVGLVTLFTVVLFIVLLFTKVKEQDTKGMAAYKDPEFKYRILIVVLSFLLLFVYCGTEIGFAQMIALYGVKGHHKLSESVASYITSVFWASFTLFRFISTFAAIKCNPLHLLSCNQAIMIVSGLILVFLGNTYVTFLWIGSAMLGVGLSSFYASTVTWVERYINVTNKIASFFVVAGSLGEMLTPLVITKNMEVAPEWLFYIMLICIVTCGVLIIALWVILRSIGLKQRLPDSANEPEKDVFLAENIAEKQTVK